MKRTFGVWFPIEQVHVLGVFILRMFLWHCPSHNEIPPKRPATTAAKVVFGPVNRGTGGVLGVIAGLHAMNKNTEAFEIPMEYQWIYL